MFVSFLVITSFLCCGSPDNIVWDVQEGNDTIIYPVIHKDTTKHDTIYRDSLGNDTIIVDTIINDSIIYDTIIQKREFYYNPIIKTSLPDPTFIKAKDGFYYLFATEDIRNTPIYKSANLIDWEFVGTAFTNETRPNFEENGKIWAPDINYFNNQYVLYYSLARWGKETTCGIGVAVADKPEGPFTDKGKILRTGEVGPVSIDPCYYEEDGKKYLLWGSHHGIFISELSDDGFSIPDKKGKIQLAGKNIEGSYLYKKNGYYYLFASDGSCCNGSKSTYHVVLGRSKELLGPYISKSGKRMLDNEYETFLEGNGYVAGPGHNGEIITDDSGQDWIIYHGYLRDDDGYGRVTFLDKVKWENDWPYIEGGVPSSASSKPIFINLQ